jgi:hypothetical protein
LGPERVRVRLAFGPDGVLESARAEGHAGATMAGYNVACAAVTVLLRTAYETAAGYDGVVVSGQAPSPGSLSFEIGRYPQAAVERLKGVGDFLSIGLSGVEREYPGLVELERYFQKPDGF